MLLSDFHALTFDCYGTLIDWESGLYTALQPLLARARPELERDVVLATFAEHESRQQAETPAMPYADLLSVVHAQLARHWGVAPVESEDRAFGASVGHWPAFADTVAALGYLRQHYRLFILSNVDRASFAGTLPRLGVPFDAVFTAEEIGSYKPDPRNFAWMIARLGESGIAKAQILHTAQSLFHDHAPANTVGLVSAWIDRRQDMQGWGATAPPPPGVRYDFRFPDLAALVRAHRAEARSG